MQNQLIEVIRHSLNAANAALVALEETTNTATETPELRVSIVPVFVDEPTAEMCSDCEVKDECEHAFTEEASVEEASVETASVETASVTAPALDTVVAELSNPRWKMRTAAELANKVELTESGLLALLNNSDVSYYTKRRNRDHALLIGLTSRRYE